MYPNRKFLTLIILVFLCCSQTTPANDTAVKDVFLPEGDNVKVEVWIKNLSIPWSLIFLPENRALLSERPGQIRLIKNGILQKEAYAKVEATQIGEGGLMGLAADPEFPRKPFIYAMHTYKQDGVILNRVIRLRDHNDTGMFDRVIIDKIPGGRYHDGGRIAFGPDGKLYITTGETTKPDMAQNLEILGGKILRLNPDGTIPDDNPFNTSAKRSPVYAYGSRNPQGLAWQPGTGKLFESEHGPSGEYGYRGHDEINIIVKGGNYGWPEVIGYGNKKSFIDPIIVWSKATPPSGITFYRGSFLRHLKGDLFVATLRSEALIRVRFEKDKVVKIERWFATDSSNGVYGRLRDVVEGPDGALYFLTNNTDGRGDPRPGDDKIYRIVPK